MDEPKFLTEAELMAALNVELGRTTLWHWRRRGMPHVKVGRAIRYDLAAVKQWLAEDQGAPEDFRWSVWHFVPARRGTKGQLEEPVWYEKCRCRHRYEAEDILKLLVREYPEIHYRVAEAMPTDIPDRGVYDDSWRKLEETYLASDED